MDWINNVSETLRLSLLTLLALVLFVSQIDLKNFH